MNTELYNQLVQADSVCKQANPYFEKANNLEEQAAAVVAKKRGMVWASIGIGFVCYWLVGMISGLIMQVRALEILGGIVMLLGIAGCVVAGIISYKKMKANKQKKADNLVAQANEMRAQASKIFDDNYNTMSILPADYWYPMATEYIVKVVQTERANTVPEALTLFDEQLHRWTMENAQMAMLAEQQAQTAHLKSIKTSSKVNAAANVANAVSNISRWF